MGKYFELMFLTYHGQRSRKRPQGSARERQDSLPRLLPSLLPSLERSQAEERSQGILSHKKEKGGTPEPWRDGKMGCLLLSGFWHHNVRFAAQEETESESPAD